MKTSELTGNALNWAVNHAEGLTDMLAPVNYCGKWEFGGPIIEREGVSLEYSAQPEKWCACIMADQEVYGPTALIAAMRCYVASKLGDEVNVPEGLA